MNRTLWPLVLRLSAMLGVLVVGGCSAGVDEAEARKLNAGRVIDCKDTRDGEAFTYRGDDVHNLRIGMAGADSCFSVTSTDGKARELCRSHEAWLKCQRR